MLATNPVALREWAVTCEALRAGRQILLLRAGGIHERHFLERESERTVVSEHREFWLLPTYLHASADRLEPRARARVEALREEAPPDGEARVRSYATVEELVFLEDRNRLGQLTPFHHWELDYVRSRFDFRKPGLWALVLRVYRRREPFVVPLTAEHAGCVSWLRLTPSLETEGLEPVLEGEEFARQRAALTCALGQDET